MREGGRERGRERERERGRERASARASEREGKREYKYTFSYMRLMRMPPSGALVTLKGNNFKSSCANKNSKVSALAFSL
jgi:hypothetical protein